MTKRLFTLKDSWIWVALLSFITAVTVKTISYNWDKVATSHTTVAPSDHTALTKVAILLMVSFILWCLAVWRYIQREGLVSLWNRSYKTDQDVAIEITESAFLLMSMKDLVKDNENINKAALYPKISCEIDKCNKYWTNWYLNRPNHKEIHTDKLGYSTDIDAALSGATLSITDKPFGAMYATKKLMGVQDGQNIVVVFDGKVVGTLDQLLALIRHEVSHLCLSALGIDPGNGGAAHHIIFTQTKFC